MSDSEPVARCPDWLAHWLARHTPSCQEVTRLTSERLDRRLSLRERISIRLHFVICFCAAATITRCTFFTSACRPTPTPSASAAVVLSARRKRRASKPPVPSFRPEPHDNSPHGGAKSGYIFRICAHPTF
jgi:hypothetical protein